MEVGIMSDTHGSKEFVENLVKWFKNEGMEKIIHLGDDYEDVVQWVDIIKVPGVFSPLYKNPKIPNRLVLEFEGWQVLITHTKESHKNDIETDIKPEEMIRNREINMLIYGHTHVPKIESKDRIIYVNPGHLRLFDKKYPKPTFGVIKFEPEMVGVKIYDFKTKVVMFSKMFVKLNKEEEK